MASTASPQESQIAGAVQVDRGMAVREQVERDLQRRNLELAALNAIASIVSQSLDMTKILNSALEKTLQVMELDGEAKGGIFVLNDGANELQLAALRGLPPKFLKREATVSLDKCLCGRVIKTGQIIDATRVNAWPDRPGWAEPHGHLLVPLKSKGQALGVMFLYLPAHHQPRDLQAPLLMAIGNQIGVGIENAQLYQQANRRLEEASLVQAVALAGAAGRPFDDIVANATEWLRHLWAGHRLGFLFPDETGALRFHLSYQGTSEAPDSASLQPGEGITGWAFQTGKPILVPDVRQDPRYIATTPETRSEMAAPLVVSDRVIGVLNVESTRLNAFSADDLHLLSALAGQLAIILDNAQAHRDLAERARQLEALYKELAETDRLKDEMVQNISHELRMPLTFLKGYVELMLDEAFDPLPPTLRKPLETVSQKIGIVAGLVDRIVNLQAVRRETLSVEPLRLTDLVQEATNHVKPHAERSGISMELELPTSLPQVAGDRHMLTEALENLLSNAIKFSPQGGRVRVSLHVERDVVCLEIADTGIGIPPDKLSKIFDRFYQVDGTATRRFGGVGVGLALVRQIIHAHGGQVWAESKGPNRGSTFHLALPTVAMS